MFLLTLWVHYEYDPGHTVKVNPCCIFMDIAFCYFEITCLSKNTTTMPQMPQGLLQYQYHYLSIWSSAGIAQSFRIEGFFTYHIFDN